MFLATVGEKLPMSLSELDFFSLSFFFGGGVGALLGLDQRSCACETCTVINLHLDPKYIKKEHISELVKSE